MIVVIAFQVQFTSQLIAQNHPTATTLSTFLLLTAETTDKSGLNWPGSLSWNRNDSVLLCDSIQSSTLIHSRRFYGLIKLKLVQEYL